MDWSGPCFVKFEGERELWEVFVNLCLLFSKRECEWVLLKWHVGALELKSQSQSKIPVRALWLLQRLLRGFFLPWSLPSSCMCHASFSDWRLYCFEYGFSQGIASGHTLPICKVSLVAWDAGRRHSSSKTGNDVPHISKAAIQIQPYKYSHTKGESILGTEVGYSTPFFNIWRGFQLLFGATFGLPFHTGLPTVWSLGDLNNLPTSVNFVSIWRLFNLNCTKQVLFPLTILNRFFL